MESAMHVSALVRAGGGLDEGAFNVQAELTRYVVGADGARQSQIINLDLAAILKGDPAADVPLQPFDVLLVKETPDWNQQGYVWMQGEVRFPGRYPVRKGEKLGSVIQRAGGLTEYAFPDGAVFTREEIKEQERKQLDTLASRMQTDLAVLSLQNAQSQEGKADAGQTLSIGQSLLADLKATKPVGRLVIDLKDSLGKNAGSEADIEVSPGDTLSIPRMRRYVTLLGEVQNATAHVWRRGLDRDQYLALSGGLTQRADAKRIYVVHADGSVVARESGRWFHSGGDVDMKPGDTIVAPLNTERVRPLTLWTSVTQIIYNLAIAAAAVNSF
jgi:protein involved in polysaccharide export with SLBB domain